MVNLYSIPIHEQPDCVKQMCDGIFFYDKDAVIALHVSKTTPINFVSFDSDKIVVNPVQFDMSWGWDLVRVHVSNYRMMQTKFDIKNIIFLTSNCLMIGYPNRVYSKYDASFSEHRHDATKITPPLLVEDYQKEWWVYQECLKNTSFVKMINDMKITNLYGGMIEGCFVNYKIMNICSDLYERYFNYKIRHYSMEEMFFATIGCNITNNICDSLLYLKTVNLDRFKELVEDDTVFFNKRIPRNIKNPIRQYYNTVIYGDINK